MSAVDKVLKKVEQERSKGHDDKALAKLKEALSEQPHEFSLVREAATLCFELGRGVEGTGILRTALKRCPEERTGILELAGLEFDRSGQLEVGELLVETALAEPDYGRAREIVESMREGDRERFLSKVRAKVNALEPEDAESTGSARRVALLLAESVALSALGRYAEMAAVGAHVLDLDPEQTETVGRLCKLDLSRARDCPDLHLLLARCYLNVREPARAAEHLAAVQDDNGTRERALQLLSNAPAAPELVPVRAHLLLLELQLDAAHDVLAEMLDGGPEGAAAVREALERGPEAARTTGPLRLLYARVLAATGATDRALRELEQGRAAGGDAASHLRVVDAILEQNPRDADLLFLRARLAGDLARHDEAALFLRRGLQIEPGRAATLKEEIASACEHAPGDAELCRLHVDTLVQMEDAQAAAAAVVRLHAAGEAKPEQLLGLSARIAGRYGFSAGLLVVFLEASLALGREDDARAALAHYYGSPGARIAEFAMQVEARLAKHPELAAGLARASHGVAVPAAFSLTLVRHRLTGADWEDALHELGSLAAADPDLREPAFAALQEFLHQRGDVPRALELAAELLSAEGRLAAASDLLARALRADPEACDRIVRRAEPLLVAAPERDEVWRPLILALVDAGRQRHARDLCQRAAQTLPWDRQGFLHAALGFVHLDAGQVSAAADAFERALQCKDVPLGRAIAGLRRAQEIDAAHGHTRYVLARALLQAGGDGADEAVEHLEAAVRLDPMLTDLALELLAEHVMALERHGPALVLEGTLSLRRGDRARGIALLEEALSAAPELAPRILQALQVQWDSGSEDVDTGIALAHAFTRCNQNRRACRLLADLARRFPDQHLRLVVDLEKLVEKEPLPEAHQALWEILIAGGDRAAALQHVKRALQGGLDAGVQRELLESAHQKLPESAWITCRLAALAIQSGDDAGAESLLRGLLERDLSAHDDVLDTLRAAGRPSEPLARLEADVLLAAERWQEALAALRQLRESFPAAGDTVLERLRLLATRGDTGLAAHLDLALLLQERGSIAEATQVLESALQPRAGAAARDPRRVDSGMVVDPLAAPVATPAQARDAADEIRLLLASLYVDQGRMQDGKELLAQVLGTAGDKSEAYAFMARISAQGQEVRRRQLQETIARSPGDAETRLELARLELLARDFEAARAALAFAAAAPATECARRYLLARTHADADRPHWAAPVLDSIDLTAVADPELRRQITQLQARCAEQLGRFAEAFAVYQQLLRDLPDSAAVQQRARAAYHKHLEASQDVPALVLEKCTSPVLTQPFCVDSVPGSAESPPADPVAMELQAAASKPTPAPAAISSPASPVSTTPAPTSPAAAGIDPR